MLATTPLSFQPHGGFWVSPCASFFTLSPPPQLHDASSFLLHSSSLPLSFCYSAWDTHVYARKLFEACVLTSRAKGTELPLHKFLLLERNSDKHHYGQGGLDDSNKKAKFLLLCIENGSQRRLQAGVTSLEEQIWKSLSPEFDLNRTQMHVQLSQWHSAL